MTSLPTQIISDYNKETKQYFWDVEAVRGNSALYSSQHFLVEHSDWETHVIAWTGELINKNKTQVPLLQKIYKMILCIWMKTIKRY